MKPSTWMLAVLGASLTMALCIAEASAARPAQKTLSRTQIAQGFAFGSGDPALGLRVDIADGQIASVTVADAATANVIAERSDGEGQTMLILRTKLDVTLKFDLYLSRDGEQFEYTSTCAVTPGISAFEMWQYPVREFALGNPRVLPEGKLTCD